VKAGDRILFAYTGNDITLDDQEYLILREEDILAKLSGIAKAASARSNFSRHNGFQRHPRRFTRRVKSNGKTNCTGENSRQAICAVSIFSGRW